MMIEDRLPQDIAAAVARALAEDLDTGDVTAALIAADQQAKAEISVREDAVLCGRPWLEEVYRQLDPSVTSEWQHDDGEPLGAGTVVCTVAGPARALLSGERTAINFLQTLSATATAARRFASAVDGTSARILDTRKTVPGLRLAQKYAVGCGGAHNHRVGLFDAFLIKENHIAAIGSVRAAVERARQRGTPTFVEVEVENMQQVREALDTDADRLLLDNFAIADMREAVAVRDAHAGNRKELEASGGVTLENVRAIAETGVDWISVGAMTKHVQAVDFSMLIV
jgi:nicotinate-nucleotide pyrophosphorylase (carboxylating)